MKKFDIIPAMDIIEGRLVRLRQGDYARETRYDSNPADLARRFLDAGLRRIHMVDLDGARQGRPVNLGVVEQVAATGAIVELGGGLRAAEDVSAAMSAGVENPILGTSLLGADVDLAHWIAQFGPRIVAGVDARNGLVASHGWKRGTSIAAVDLVQRLESAGFARVIYTDIATDGMLNGPNIDQLRQVAGSTSMEVTASGGIGSVAHIEAVVGLAGDGITGVVVGRAFYDGKITLEELAAC